MSAKKNIENLINDKGCQFRSFAFTATEERAEGESPALVLEGKACAFNSVTVLYRDNNYEAREVVSPGAFRGCDMSDVIFNYNHCGRVYARTRNNTLQLEVRDDGLYMRAVLRADDPGHKELYNDIKSGTIDRMSFAFTVSADEWEQGNGYDLRRITSIDKLYDVSCVDMPAYDETSISARRKFGEVIEERARARESAENEAYYAEQRKKVLEGTYETDENQINEWYMDYRYCTLDELLEHRVSWINGDLVTERSQERFVRIASALKAIAELESEHRKRMELNETTLKMNNGVPLDEIMRRNCVATHSKEANKMENMEIRALKEYISGRVSEEYRSALNINGTGAVIPVEIFNKIIKDEKFADLLASATVINKQNVGTVKIPISTTGKASWKAEEASVAVANPVLTAIELKGTEIMRAVSYTAAVGAMTEEDFVDWLVDLVASELVATLEETFILGDSTTTDAPHDGIAKLSNSDIAGAVQVTGDITAEDLAEAISKLPAKYANKAVVMVNTKTAMNVIGLFKGTDEYAFGLADAAQKFMGKSIRINEYIPDDEIYVADPSQLYVAFSAQPTIDVDKSAGFLSAVNYIRCLAVVDFAWNPAAVAKVYK